MEKAFLNLEYIAEAKSVVTYALGGRGPHKI